MRGQGVQRGQTGVRAAQPGQEDRRETGAGAGCPRRGSPPAGPPSLTQPLRPRGPRPGGWRDSHPWLLRVQSQLRGPCRGCVSRSLS